MNQFIVTGRLTKDPEVKYMPTGKATVSVVVAVDRWSNNEKKTDFPRITIYGSMAENLQQYTEKGSKILVRGRIQTGSYEKDGKTIYTTDHIADLVEYLDHRTKEPEFTDSGEKLPF